MIEWSKNVLVKGEEKENENEPQEGATPFSMLNDHGSHHCADTESGERCDRFLH